MSTPGTPDTPGGAESQGSNAGAGVPPDQPAQPPQVPPTAQPGQPPNQQGQPLPGQQVPPVQPGQPGQPPNHPGQPHPAPGPVPAPGHHPPRAAVTVPLGKMLYLCVAALGVINLFLGYVSAGDGDSTNLYKAAVAVYTVAPTMLFLGGLIALRTVLPRERPPGALPAMVTTAIFVPLVLSAISSDGAGDLQTLFLVFGAVQLLLAWFAYLFDAGLIAARR